MPRPASADADSVERLALQNPETRARFQEVTRERKARERLVELATGNGRAKPKEKATRKGETSDTEKKSRKSAPSSSTAEPEEDPGNS